MRQNQLVTPSMTGKKHCGKSLTPNHDAVILMLLLNSTKKELSRLERNKERREAREKQKGIFSASTERDAGSPSATPAPAEKPTGTTRKCANCGQAGHIKTNKKYCNDCAPDLTPLFPSLKI
jgi:transcription initiation factor TFIID subunit 1, fungi type